MKARPLLVSLVAGAVLAAVAFATAPRTEHPDAIRVHVVAERNDGQRELRLQAMEAYLKASSHKAYELHFVQAGEVLPSTAELIKHLKGVSNIGAEAPLHVALAPPSSRSTKELRVAMEREFHGQTRREILRALVPVLSLPLRGAKDACRQLDDDIDYAESNFGGIAFRFDEGGVAFLKTCTPQQP